MSRFAPAVALLALGLAACSQAPTLAVPEVPIPAAYKEVAPWAPATPNDRVSRGAWWALFADPDLDALEERLAANSPDLAAAFARYRQAVATADQVRAIPFPTLGVSFNTQADRQAELRPLRVLGPNSPDQYRAHTLGFNLDYEFDLWGRVRNLVVAGNATQEAAQADLESARMSLQAQLAESYLVLRGLDRDVALLREAEDAYGKALGLIERRREGGIASGLDLARAQTQLESTRSQVRQSMAQRAVVEHAIAALVGAAAPDFTIAPRTTPIALPVVPASVPSELLQRRADIAAAQRRVVAANASVGVSRAAWFPALTLNALFGLQSSDIGQLFTTPNTFWAVGPTLAASLFDGGRRTAEVARTQAVLDENGARYKAVVLGAFQQVEDALALLDHYRAAAASEEAAYAAAQRALDLSLARYREGAASYLEVVTSQTAALQAQRNALDLANRQRRASVQLVRALGGGWSTVEPRAN